MLRIRHDTGYTLVEVLAVVAIIGILASVTLSSLSAARENARNKNAVAVMQRLMIEASLYRANNPSYAGLCASGVITDLSSDIQEVVGNSPNCHDSVLPGYEIHVGLLGGQTYCVDSRKTFNYVDSTNAIDNHDCSS